MPLYTFFRLRPDSTTPSFRIEAFPTPGLAIGFARELVAQAGDGSEIAVVLDDVEIARLKPEAARRAS